MRFISDKSKYSCCYKHAYWEAAGLPVLPGPPPYKSPPGRTPPALSFPYWVNCPLDCVYKAWGNDILRASTLKYPTMILMKPELFISKT